MSLAIDRDMSRLLTGSVMGLHKVIKLINSQVNNKFTTGNYYRL